MKFVSLHSHTSFSSGDGHGSPAEHVARVKELGMSALALTEHGTVSSHVQLEQAALKAGIKPIFGVEAYVAEPGEKRKFHQTILAMNEEGYRNLSRMVTESYKKKEDKSGFYHYPTINTEALLNRHGTEGLVILSGCADSWLSCTLAGGKSQGLRVREDIGPAQYSDEDRLQMGAELVERFLEVYGDRYYLEVQPFSNYDRTVFLNQQIESLSKELDVPLVATADAHYPYPEDWEIQKLSNSIKWKIPMDKMDRDYEADPCTYPESDREMAFRLIRAGVSRDGAVKAINNSARVADRLNVTLPKTSQVRFSESNGTPSHAAYLLKEAIKEGVKFRAETNERFREDFLKRKAEYTARIKKELAVIIPKDFSDYFLINQQILGWAKDNGIAVGPGRGSAAGSLVCYLLRISEVNPMEFPQMLFERFLDPGREDPPDVDTDYADDRRNEVFDYARSIYGIDNVGNIGNFSRFRGKTAIKDTAKALQVPPWEAEEYCEFIVEAPYGDPREFDTAEDASLAFPEAKKIIDKHPGLDLAFRLEGDQKTLGVHAAGMVISNDPISDTCAIYEREKTNGDMTEVLAYDKRDSAYLGMLKLDCLGLKTMTIISDTIKSVNEGGKSDVKPTDDV